MRFALDRAIIILRRTPDTLRALLAGLPDDWASANEGPDTWSPKDIVGHLIHGEETDWVVRARIIVEEGEAVTFTPFDRHAFKHKYEGYSLEELLQRFAQVRESNLNVLATMHIGLEQLTLRGKHPEFGAVSLEQLLATWVVHDLSHIGQIVRVMGKQYTAAVGPWIAYLPMLTR